jgi:hypothetical protein
MKNKNFKTAQIEAWMEVVNKQSKEETTMKLRFISPFELDSNIKVTIHKTGKLGFTMAAAKKFGLDKGMSMSIGIDEEDKNSRNLYAIIYGDDSGDFKIARAGQYYYAQTRDLFKYLKVDYSKGDIIYDISLFERSEPVIYKLTRRS